MVSLRFLLKGLGFFTLVTLMVVIYAWVQMEYGDDDLQYGETAQPALLAS